MKTKEFKTNVENMKNITAGQLSKWLENLSTDELNGTINHLATHDKLFGLDKDEKEVITWFRIEVNSRAKNLED